MRKCLAIVHQIWWDGEMVRWSDGPSAASNIAKATTYTSLISKKIKDCIAIRILRGKIQPQIKLNRIRKVRFVYLSNWYIKSTIYKRFLYSNQIFQKLNQSVAKVHSLWWINFVLPIQFFLSLVFGRKVFNVNVALSFVVSTLN